MAHAVRNGSFRDSLQCRFLLHSALPLLLLTPVLAGCSLFGPKVHAHQSVPTANGSVYVAKNAEQRSVVELQVEHLALPDRVDSTADAYVVWTKALGEGATATRLGHLVVDRELRGRLVAETDLENFDLFVTAEKSADAKKPEGQRVLWTEIR